MDDRHLTEADVDAIVSALERRVAEKFYRDLGKGVWGLVWKALVIGLLAVAAYGAMRSGG